MGLVTDTVSQSDNIHGILSGYFQSLANSLTSTAEYPDLADTIQFGDFSRLLESAMNNQKSSATFANGAAIDVIHTFTAVTREFNMCQMTRSAYMQRQVSECQSEISYYDTAKMFTSNSLKGNTVGNPSK